MGNDNKDMFNIDNIRSLIASCSSFEEVKKSANTIVELACERDFSLPESFRDFVQAINSIDLTDLGFMCDSSFDDIFVAVMRVYLETLFIKNETIIAFEAKRDEAKMSFNRANALLSSEYNTVNAYTDYNSERAEAHDLTSDARYYTGHGKFEEDKLESYISRENIYKTFYLEQSLLYRLIHFNSYLNSTKRVKGYESELVDARLERIYGAVLSMQAVKNMDGFVDKYRSNFSRFDTMSDIQDSIQDINFKLTGLGSKTFVKHYNEMLIKYGDLMSPTDLELKLKL